jgi:hypothetical protein
VTRTRLFAAAAAAACLLTGCQRSAEELAGDVRDKPGVLHVTVVDNGGEDDVPFTDLPWVITVKMRAGATRSQIRDVARAYEEDMKDAEVESVTIQVDDRGGLVLGETTGETERWVDALAYGLREPGLEGIEVSAWNPGASIGVRLASADFETLQRYVEHYVEPYRLADFSFAGGAFKYYASENYQEGQRLRAAARFATAVAVHRRFGLRGVSIDGSRSEPLRLIVGPGASLSEVRAYATQVAASQTGRIVVSRASRS